MTNFLNETKEYILDTHKTIKDIIFIGSLDSGYSCTWDEFQLLANFEYDSGFGKQEIAPDLVIVFNDYTYLYRFQYDGQEDWRYIGKVILPLEQDRLQIKSLKIKRHEDTLREING